MNKSSPENEQVNTLIEFHVQIGVFKLYKLNSLSYLYDWKTKFTTSNIEDAKWMDSYLSLIKGKTTRIIESHTSNI